MTDRIPLDLIGIRIELPTNTPILLLKEQDGDRYLPIWINTPEATSIALARDGIQPERPLTHDLLVLGYLAQTHQEDSCHSCGTPVLNALSLDGARLCSQCFELRYKELGGEG